LKFGKRQEKVKRRDLISYLILSNEGAVVLKSGISDFAVVNMEIEADVPTTFEHNGNRTRVKVQR